MCNMYKTFTVFRQSESMKEPHDEDLSEDALTNHLPDYSNQLVESLIYVHTDFG